MKFIKAIFLTTTLVVIAGFILVQVPAVQDRVFRQLAPAALGGGFGESDNLRVYVCGSASPLGNAADRAQACIAVVTPDHFYLFDAGAGSSAEVQRGGLPLDRLDGVFLTHFHSDHIADIQAFNLSSWVAGRPAPIQLIGPVGVDKIARGLNLAYELDRGYRTAHHGADLLPPELHVLDHQEIQPGAVLDDRGLKITAFTVVHDPIKPAVGYRIDYKGRSVVISGDSIATSRTFDVAANVDLLFHDALSKEALVALIDVIQEAGRDRVAQIVTDVLDYHADVHKLEAMSADAGVKQLVLYHLVPTPVNGLLMRIWRRGLLSSTLIASDGMTFELPAGEGPIVVTP